MWLLPIPCVLGVLNAIVFQWVTADIPPVSTDTSPWRNFKTHTDKDVIHNVLLLWEPHRGSLYFTFFFKFGQGKRKAHLLLAKL